MLPKGMILVFCALSFMMAACDDDDDSNPTGPDVSLQTDNFRFTATAMVNLTDTLSYSWENTGTIAHVTQTPSIATGTAAVVLLDADSMQVYSRNLADTGMFMSTTGTAGVWTVRVTLTGVSGDLTFRAEKGT